MTPSGRFRVLSLGFGYFSLVLSYKISLIEAMAEKIPFITYMVHKEILIVQKILFITPLIK